MTANTTWKTDPATTSQLNYLDSLLASRDPRNLTHALITAQRNGTMTKGEASKAIDTLQNMPKTPKGLSSTFASVTEQVNVVAGQFNGMTTAAATTASVMDSAAQSVKAALKVEVGIYDLHPELPAPTAIPSGRWIIVYPSKHGGLRVKRLYKSYSTKSGFSWKQSSTIHFNGIKMGHYTKVSVEDVAKLGQTVGFCFYCGSFLSDPESKSKGYGPICAKHYGLPWGK